MSSDRLPLVENALAGVAFFVTHQLTSGEPVPPTLIQTFAKVRYWYVFTGVRNTHTN